MLEGKVGNISFQAKSDVWNSKKDFGRQMSHPQTLGKVANTWHWKNTPAYLARGSMTMKKCSITLIIAQIKLKHNGKSVPVSTEGQGN
jgi:hypothetical protein